MQPYEGLNGHEISQRDDQSIHSIRYSMLGHVESTVSLLTFRVTQETATKCGDFLAYIGNDRLQKKKKSLPAYAAWRFYWKYPPRIEIEVHLYSNQMACIVDHDLIAGTA